MKTQTIKMTSLSKKIEDRLNRLVENANLVDGYLERVVYRQYQKAQKDRWTTENTSAFSAPRKWDALDPSYAAYKKRKFSDFIGHGEKMLIATGRLFQGVIGPSEDHRSVIGDKKIEIYTSVPYASYVDEDRSFTKFSPSFYSDIFKGLNDYLMKRIVKDL